MTATDRYCQLWAAWRQAVSKKLAAVDPRVLSGYLRIASGKTGATRSELQSELGWEQSRESKMSAKLQNADWLEIVKKRRGKGTVEFLRMTPLAISVMKKLEASLRALSPARAVTRAAPPKGGGLRRPANATGNLLDAISQDSETDDPSTD